MKWVGGWGVVFEMVSVVLIEVVWGGMVMW